MTNKLITKIQLPWETHTQAYHPDYIHQGMYIIVYFLFKRQHNFVSTGTQTHTVVKKLPCTFKIPFYNSTQ